MSKEYIVSIPPQSKKSPFALTLTGITYENPWYEINRPSCDIFTMEYVISGKGHIEINGHEYIAETGDSYILPNGKNIRYYSDRADPWRKIWFNAQGAFLSETARIFGLSGRIVFPKTNTLPYFKRILKICENKALSADEINTLCAPVFTELIMFISSEINKNDSISDEAMTLKRYIDSRIEENISIKTLSKLIFRSESQTIRIFKKNFNTTPYDYLLDNKINRAKEIILNTNLSVKETAYRLGFSDEHYFSGIFHKKTGLSPTEYRKQNFIRPRPV